MLIDTKIEKVGRGQSGTREKKKNQSQHIYYGEML